MWWDKQNKYVYVPGILGTEQRGVCTDDGELLLLCYPCHQKPPHLHAVLDPQRAQDGQLPKPSGKGFTAAAQICALYIYFNGLHLRLHQLFNLLLDAGIQVLAPYWKKCILNNLFTFVKNIVLFYNIMLHTFTLWYYLFTTDAEKYFCFSLACPGSSAGS